MDRVNNIIALDIYNDYLGKIREAEKKRFFCLHDFGHAVDVARIAYIMSLEENGECSKEVIYAAALLHDIGRWIEYMDDTDHAEASARLAEPILKICGFTAKETGDILQAIREHRRYEPEGSNLGQIIYRSDKECRRCWECDAIKYCKRFAKGETPVLNY